MNAAAQFKNGIDNTRALHSCEICDANTQSVCAIPSATVVAIALTVRINAGLADHGPLCRLLIPFFLFGGGRRRLRL